MSESTTGESRHKYTRSFSQLLGQVPLGVYLTEAWMMVVIATSGGVISS